ncbi:MAG: PAS domain S-box protein [Gemmatimonadaceae bacterium]
MVNLLSPVIGVALGVLLGASMVALAWRRSVRRGRSVAHQSSGGLPVASAGESGAGNPAVLAVLAEAPAAANDALLSEDVSPHSPSAVDESAAELVRRNEDYFRLLIQNASDIITVVDHEGVLRYSSPAVERLLGWRPEELEGRHALQLVHQDDIPHLRLLAERATSTPNDIVMGKYRVRHKDGAWRMLEGTGRVETDLDGAPIAVVNSRDVTERDELQARLMHANKMESIGRLAGGIAHDFNNLLTGILTSTEMVKERIPDDHEVVPDLIEILRAGGRASELTRQLLAFARLEQSRPQVIDVNEMVSDLSSLLRRLLGESIALHIELGSDVPNVLADISQLEQVMVNLAVNARDAMPGGGDLHIRSRVEVHGGSHAGDGTSGETRWMVLEVEDTGVGMGEDVLRRLFEPFFTTKSSGRGTGLGLATCYGIVTAHGGRIDVDSRPNDGARFRVMLPSTIETKSREPERTRRELPPVRRGGRETILLVEDDADVREVTARALRRSEYTVLEAADAAEALRELEEQGGAVALVIADVVLPQMSGAELAMRVRSRWPHVQLLLTSGYPSESLNLADVERLGIPLLPKPYTSAILLFEVRLRLDGAARY